MEATVNLEGVPYTTLSIFGKEIEVKNTLCASDPNYQMVVDPTLHLYIKLTDCCPAHCLFCSNRGMIDHGTLDFSKLRQVVRTLMESGRLHGVSITGGEPMLSVSLLNDTLNLVLSETDGVVPISFNTNGIHFRSLLSLDGLSQLESVHLSRHHYFDSVNASIFGVDIVPCQEIQYVLERLENKSQLVVNCLLMKDYIGTLSDVKKFLDWAGDIGISKVGFVSLMPVNSYAQQQFVDFRDVFDGQDPAFLEAHHFFDQQVCECCDGIYVSSHTNLVEYYARMTKDMSCPYVRQLVYTSDNRLTIGFGKEDLY